MKGVIGEVFSRVVEYLVAEGYVKLEDYFVDGTKVEANANAHKVVWAKRTEKNKDKLRKKIDALLEEIDRVNEQEEGGCRI